MMNNNRSKMHYYLGNVHISFLKYLIFPFTHTRTHALCSFDPSAVLAVLFQSGLNLQRFCCFGFCMPLIIILPENIYLFKVNFWTKATVIVSNLTLTHNKKHWPNDYKKKKVLYSCSAICIISVVLLLLLSPLWKFESPDWNWNWQSKCSHDFTRGVGNQTSDDVTMQIY